MKREGRNVRKSQVQTCPPNRGNSSDPDKIVFFVLLGLSCVASFSENPNYEEYYDWGLWNFPDPMDGSNNYMLITESPAKDRFGNLIKPESSPARDTVRSGTQRRQRDRDGPLPTPTASIDPSPEQVDPLACARPSPVAHAVGRWRLASRTRVATAKKTHKMDLQGGANQATKVTLLNRRGVVECTWAWWMHVRRYARDYPVLTRHSEAGIQRAMSHLLRKRIK